VELKLGYQQTELGVIPEDWEIHELGELRPFVTSGSRGWADYYSKYGDLFVRITNLTRKSIYLDLADCKFVKLPQNNSEGVRTQLCNNDVLISITADIGIIGYIDDHVPKPAYINQHIALVRLDPEVANARFVSYYLASAEPQKKFQASTDTGAKAGMSLAGVQKIKTLLPPTIEQSAIATALSDVDALLAAQDALIAKKRAIKQGAMQELLTGKRRLPGFRGEWKVMPASQLGFFRGGTGFPLTAQGDQLGEYPFFKVSDMNNDGNRTHMVHANNLISENTRTRLGATAFPAGGIVFAKVGAAIFLERKKILVRPSCIDNNLAAFIFDTTMLDVSFVHSQLTSVKFGDFVATTALPSLNAKVLGQLPLALPPTKEEQTAIAQVLSDMDNQLVTLENSRSKTALLKQGMMQELLTGKTRLV